MFYLLRKPDFAVHFRLVHYINDVFYMDSLSQITHDSNMLRFFENNMISLNVVFTVSKKIPGYICHLLLWLPSTGIAFFRMLDV